MKVLRNKKGYTLIEMMVVVAIIGVLSAMAVPTYISYLPHLRLNSAVRDLISYARSARSQATITGRNTQLNFILTTYPTPDTTQILDDSTALIGYAITTPFNVEISEVRVGGGVYNSGNSATDWPNDMIRFTPLGSVVNGVGNVVDLSILVCSVSTSGTGCGAGAGGIEFYRIDIPGYTGNPKVCSGWSNPCP